MAGKKQAKSTQVQGKPNKKVSMAEPCPWLCNLVPDNLPRPGSAQSVLHPRKDVFVLKVKIRVPKSTSKPPKLTASQLKVQQNCTCEDDESVCSETCGFNTFDTGNRIDFQIPDDMCEAFTHRNALNSEMTYSKNEKHDTLCNVCNVTPKDAPKGVQAQKVLHPNKDVFILKIGKQTDEPNRTGNIEVELVTPRAPAKKKPATHNCIQIQCDEDDIPCFMPCKTCRGMPLKKKKIRRSFC